MPIDLELLAKELRRDEHDGQDGSGVVYKCPAGKLTVGFGHNIEDNPISARVAEMILQDDIGQTLADCERLDYFHTLSDVRKRVIMNMMFNMGMYTFLKFKRMAGAIRAQDWELAADEMMNSRWYNQVGDRAKRLVNMMREG